MISNCPFCNQILDKSTNTKYISVTCRNFDCQFRDDTRIFYTYRSDNLKLIFLCIDLIVDDEMYLISIYDKKTLIDKYVGYIIEKKIKVDFRITFDWNDLENSLRSNVLKILKNKVFT